MKKIQFTHSSSQTPQEQIEIYNIKLQPEIQQMNQATQEKYQNKRASINLPNDKNMLNQIQHLITEKQQLKPKYLIVIGIGGSNLGTIAVQEAVLGKHYNLLNPPLPILYADTVDSDNLHTIIHLIKPILQQKENVLINVISKSGATTETIANFDILLSTIKKHKQDYSPYIVVTTDKNSKFWDYANHHNFSILEIPKKVGGRFSVFSPVGLFPLGMLQINISQLIEGAQSIQHYCLQSEIKLNPAALSASLIHYHKQHGKNIHDLLIFSPDLESIGKWYRQLMAESLGKQYDINMNEIYTGITPLVSIGSTDLHSMAQLNLGGPYDKFTTFLRVQQNRNNLMIPIDDELNNLAPGFQGKNLQQVMHAILTGVQQAYRNGNRPFVEIQLPDKSEYCIGQFLQFKMMEIMYLGFLMNVNPFDQPNVEDYKIETKKLLQAEER